MSDCWNPVEELTYSQEGLDTISQPIRNKINEEYKALERQLAEAREEIKDLHDIKNRMFSMMQMAYVDHEAFKPLFESMCNMIKEEIKEKGDE